MEQKELKFRALDIKREKWIYFYLGENFNYIVDTVGQYIGRKDENKKEIYEGDIIRVPYGKRFRLFEIAWDKEDRTPSFWGYCLTEPRKDESYRLGDHFEVLHEDGEIIGNIHENKP